MLMWLLELKGLIQHCLAETVLVPSVTYKERISAVDLLLGEAHAILTAMKQASQQVGRMYFLKVILSCFVMQ